MSAPKSVTKIIANDGNCKIEFTDSVDATQYELCELTRAALRDVGKFVSKQFKESYYGTFKKHTGNAGKSIKYKVWASKNTKYPRVEIGLKGGKGFYSMYEEFGSSTTPRYGLLTHAVEDNVNEIIRIEEQYLPYLRNNASQKIDSESEYEGDADGTN